MAALSATTLSILIFYSLTGLDKVRSATTCGDWEPYKDEKCIKIFSAPGLVNYSDAEAYCQDQTEAHLLTIAVPEEQEFIENFLKSKSIVDNVWMGLKYDLVDDNYKWSDGTELHYTNWGEGSPKNDPDYCVQMQTEVTDYGKWNDVICTRKNLVICEKIQLWSATQLQQTVMNMLKNPLPIGFIYVQLAKERSPAEIWPLMEWEDVSGDYSGVFFRAIGGNSAPFGELQESDAPRLNGVQSTITGPFNTEVQITPDDVYSPVVDSYGLTTEKNYTGLRFRVTAAEVRPRNMAVRIWKRIR